MRSGTVRGLKRDHVVTIGRMHSSKISVGTVRERSLYSISSVTISQRRDLRMTVI